MLVKRGNHWKLVSKRNPKKVLKDFGTQHPSKEAVHKREAEVQMFKHMTEMNEIRKLAGLPILNEGYFLPKNSNKKAEETLLHLLVDDLVRVEHLADDYPKIQWIVQHTIRILKEQGFFDGIEEVLEIIHNAFQKVSQEPDLPENIRKVMASSLEFLNSIYYFEA